MRDRLHRPPEQLLARVAGDLAEAVVDPGEAARGVDFAEASRGLVDVSRKPPLALLERPLRLLGLGQIEDHADEAVVDTLGVERGLRDRVHPAPQAVMAAIARLERERLEAGLPGDRGGDDAVVVV